MNEDPIVAEIRRYRAEHAEKYGHNLGRICEALREIESRTSHKLVHRKPRLLLQKIAANKKNPVGLATLAADFKHSQRLRR